MVRARLYAGAAVFATAVALASPAQAQFACAALGSPQPTPPCIIVDVSKIAATVEDIQQKTAQIQQLQQQISQYTNIQSLLGVAKKRALCTFKPNVPIAPLPADKGDYATVANARSASLPTGGGEDSTTKVAEAEKSRVQVRSAAGDGYSISQVTKVRLDEMAVDAQKIEAAAGKSTDVRTDWQINTAARSLMLRSLATLKELRAAGANLNAEQTIATTRTTARFNFKRAVAVAATVAAIVPEWSQKLGNIAGLSNKLQALITAKQLSTSYAASISGHQDTQREYQQTLAAAQQAQNDVQSLAYSDGARKKVSGASLLARADAIMQSMDQTTWDDPGKYDVSKRAAQYAKERLDDMVSGEVSDSWVDLLIKRADAYKQEAYFRPVNAEAKDWEANDRKTLAEFEQSVGFSISNVPDLDRQIAELQAQLSAAGKELDSAPDAVKVQRDAIYKSTLEGSDYDGGVQTDDAPADPPVDTR